MDIPKTKIIIYLLTFAGYAWSGYGRTVITNLKDAVLSAESFFGDLAVKVVEVVKKLKTVHDTLNESLEEDCIWTCPGGGKAVKNKYYKPVSNGCGPLGLEIDANLPYPEMTKCCNEHDLCYGTCNVDKDNCDLAFKKCLYKICDTAKVEEIILKGCKASAKLLYTGTATMGCKFYLDSQKEACYCKPKKNHSEL
nr:group XIIA secretory phospholipase A2 [Halyomorpha halys]